MTLILSIDSNFEGTFVEDHNLNKSFHKHIVCHPAQIFVNIQKAKNNFDFLTHPICKYKNI